MAGRNKLTALAREPERPLNMLLGSFGEPDPYASADAYAASLPKAPARPSLMDLLAQTWPAQLAKSAYGAATLPGDVYAGRVDPMSDAGIGRANDLAGLVMSGGTLGAPVKAGEAMFGAGPVRAYHAAYEPFTEFDFKRLGQATRPNVEGTGVEDWAMALAKLGAWASKEPVASKMAAPYSLPVDVSGKAKAFPSLDALANAIAKNGGPDAYRKKLVDNGFGHVRVKDEEMGTTSFVGLSPDTFKMFRQ